MDFRDCSGSRIGGKWKLSLALTDVHPEFLKFIMGELNEVGVKKELAPEIVVPSRESILERGCRMLATAAALSL